MKTKIAAMGLLGAMSLAGFAQPALADGEEAASSWSATLAVTSDYRFRGISQNDRNAAVQGSIDFSHSSGFFAGVWASNIDFNDEATYDSEVEVDLYAGYSYAFSDATEGSFKVVYYWYPGADAPPLAPDYDYFEAIASVSHDFGVAAASLELAYSPDYFAETGDAVALTGGVEVPLIEKLGLVASGHVGYQWIDDNAAFGVPDYAFYDAGMSATFSMFTLDVRWVDTDMSTLDCVGGTDLCEGGVVVTGSLAFGG